jgi:hypothetical protein
MTGQRGWKWQKKRLLPFTRWRLEEAAIAACFTGRGPRKKRLPQIIGKT